MNGVIALGSVALHGPHSAPKEAISTAKKMEAFGIKSIRDVGVVVPNADGTVTLYNGQHEAVTVNPAELSSIKGLDPQLVKAAKSRQAIDFRVDLTADATLQPSTWIRDPQTGLPVLAHLEPPSALRMPTKESCRAPLPKNCRQEFEHQRHGQSRPRGLLSKSAQTARAFPLLMPKASKLQCLLPMFQMNFQGLSRLQKPVKERMFVPVSQMPKLKPFHQLAHPNSFALNPTKLQSPAPAANPALPTTIQKAPKLPPKRQMLQTKPLIPLPNLALAAVKNRFSISKKGGR